MATAKQNLKRHLPSLLYDRLGDSPDFQFHCLSWFSPEIPKQLKIRLHHLIWKLEEVADVRYVTFSDNSYKS